MWNLLFNCLLSEVYLFILLNLIRHFSGMHCFSVFNHLNDWGSFSGVFFIKVKVKSLSCVRLFATPWTVTYQAPWSMGFSRQEYWSGLPSPTPGESSQPRNQTCVSCVSCIDINHWATREAIPEQWKWNEVAQLCPTLCDPMDSSLPGSVVHGIFQARILECCHFLLQGIRVDA